MRKRILALLLCMASVIAMAGCSSGGENRGDGSGEGSQGTEAAGETLKILSGSENQELEEIINACSEETGVEIEMDYKGSVDIMRELESGAWDYDAVWPASSIWISMGDTDHIVKHAQSVSMTPVVFGIRQSLAEELGFTGRDVYVSDLLSAIEDGKMRFCMTSATQSNSGASAYIGFLYALLGRQEGMTSEDLQQETLQTQVRELLSGVERSSGSSDWLKDLFLEGDYDAMVNYECLVIDANEQLEEEGKEPLQVIYPSDGLTIADSPLGYLDHGESGKEDAFLAVQEYLLSDEAQSAIEATGRRIRANGVSDENRDVFNSDWGIDTERILSPIQMPDADVLREALDLYQTAFKKPSLNVYCLDFSGSMYGEGEQQLKEAMQQILIQEFAARNLLQASEGEVNVVIPFNEEVMQTFYAADDSNAALEDLYNEITGYEAGGGTNIYVAAREALEIACSYDLDQYTPAIILMTDGRSLEGMREFEQTYENAGEDVPVFSITFGDADPNQLEDLAALTGGRVFDGTDNLTEAFRSVKGYN